MTIDEPWQVYTTALLHSLWNILNGKLKPLFNVYDNTVHHTADIYFFL